MHLDLALNDCLDWEKLEQGLPRSQAGIDECYQCTSVVSSCDECQLEDIEAIRTSIALLSGDVATYATCHDYKTEVIQDVQDVNADIDALILKLQQDDTASWQAAFTQYSMDCSYVPGAYCESMQTSNTQACEVCGNSCQSFGSEC